MRDRATRLADYFLYVQKLDSARATLNFAIFHVLIDLARCKRDRKELTEDRSKVAPSLFRSSSKFSCPRSSFRVVPEIERLSLLPLCGGISQLICVSFRKKGKKNERKECGKKFRGNMKFGEFNSLGPANRGKEKRKFNRQANDLTNDRSPTIVSSFLSWMLIAREQTT